MKVLCAAAISVLCLAASACPTLAQDCVAINAPIPPCAMQYWSNGFPGGPNEHKQSAGEIYNQSFQNRVQPDVVSPVSPYPNQ